MTTHHLLLKTSWDSRVVFLMTSPNRSSLNHESKNSWGGVESLFPPRHSWWMVSLRATKKNHLQKTKTRTHVPISSIYPTFLQVFQTLAWNFILMTLLGSVAGIEWFGLGYGFSTFPSFEKSHKTYPISRVTSREPPEGGISWKSWAWMHDMFGNLQFPSFSESLAVSVRVEVPTCTNHRHLLHQRFKDLMGNSVKWNTWGDLFQKPSHWPPFFCWRIAVNEWHFRSKKIIGFWYLGPSKCMSPYSLNNREPCIQLFEFFHGQFVFGCFFSGKLGL